MTRESEALTPRTLVIGPAWIGDMVMAQSLFMALKRQAPERAIDVLGPPWAPALLARMPEVDRAIAAEIAHGELALGKRWRLGQSLRAARYDHAIAMSRSLKSALIPWFARIPRRTGYRGEPRYPIVNDMRELNTTDLAQKAQHYVALGLPAGAHSRAAATIDYPRLSIDEANRDALVEKHALSLRRPIVALAPGAAHGPAKRWPASHYALLARELAAYGYDCWIFGGDVDRDTGREVAAAAPEHCVDFCGKTRLVDVIDLMSLARTAVGNDTGLTHMASAVVPQVVALYGSTHPAYAPPLCARPTSLWLGLACAPCKQKECPLGHTFCMRDIPVADVLMACIEPDHKNIDSRYSPARWDAAHSDHGAGQ